MGAARDNCAVLAGHAPIRHGTRSPFRSRSALRGAQEVVITATRVLPAGMLAAAVVWERQVRVLWSRPMLVVGGIERGWKVELHVW